MKTALFVIGLVMLLLVTVAIVLVANLLTKPIRTVTEGRRALAGRGRVTSSNDEVGRPPPSSRRLPAREGHGRRSRRRRRPDRLGHPAFGEGRARQRVRPPGRRPARDRRPRLDAPPRASATPRGRWPTRPTRPAARSGRSPPRSARSPRAPNVQVQKVETVREAAERAAGRARQRRDAPTRPPRPAEQAKAIASEGLVAAERGLRRDARPAPSPPPA